LTKILMLFMMPDVVAGKKLSDLIIQSSVFAKIILLILVVFSVVSWAIIIFKYFEVHRSLSSSASFLKEFRRSRNLEKSFGTLSKMPGSPLSAMYASAFIELESFASPQEQNKKITIDDEGLNHVAEAIDRTGTDEILRLEKYVVFLATTANASPFLGLLGTVWGIMESFAEIGVRGTATLAVVAPGIAEALIATVAGLAAAIPALIGYNYYINKIRRIAGEIDNFKSELFTAIKKELTLIA
jgi:biopolymer transport protein TolQ